MAKRRKKKKREKGLLRKLFCKKDKKRFATKTLRHKGIWLKEGRRKEGKKACFANCFAEKAERRKVICYLPRRKKAQRFLAKIGKRKKV